MKKIAEGSGFCHTQGNNNKIIIKRRLRKISEEKLENWQHGFKPERGKVDFVFALINYFKTEDGNRIKAHTSLL